ncbi:recombinase family protein [Escherichia coli]|uniref:recombinase family protein n=1 Tax=Escherichia coli TaxID=562 RepID=UPI003976B3FD
MGHRAAIYCRVSTADQSCERQEFDLRAFAGCAGYDVVGIFKETGSGTKLDRAERKGTVAKLAMRQPFVLFKGLTFQKLCLPGAFRPGDHHNKMLRPGLCVVHASPQYL